MPGLFRVLARGVEHSRYIVAYRARYEVAIVIPTLRESTGGYVVHHCSTHCCL